MGRAFLSTRQKLPLTATPPTRRAKATKALSSPRGLFYLAQLHPNFLANPLINGYGGFTTPNPFCMARVISHLKTLSSRVTAAFFVMAKMAKNKPEIKMVPVEDLIPYVNNSRTHSDKQVDQIASSIKEFGFTNPILTDGENGIIAGHGRLMAARKLKLAEVPVIELAHLSETQRRAYIIADNKLALNAGWDEELLKIEIEHLKADGFETLLLGWDEDQIEDLLNFGPELDIEEKEDGSTQSGPGSLVANFGIPPFSVFDARQGYWQERKRAWLNFGLRSEEGRGETLMDYGGGANIKGLDTSIFDPVLCEILINWFSPEHGSILDPFAGGSVRGMISAFYGRNYTGIDIRQEQIDDNLTQASNLLPADGQERVKWICGDSSKVLPEMNDEFDFIISCPPYHDLEVYSDKPGDLSNIGKYEDFIGVYSEIIKASVNLLRENCFACWVLGDIRDPKTGHYRGFVKDTISIFESFGMFLYNDIVLVTAIASASMRAPRIFRASRKVIKTHQNVLVFVKGDPKKAVLKLSDPNLSEIDLEAE